MSKGTFIVATIAVLGAMVGVIAAIQYSSSNPVGLYKTHDLNEVALRDLWSHWKLAYGKNYASAE